VTAFPSFSAPAWHIAAGIALGIGGLAVLWYLAGPLAVLLLGITLAEALSPIVDRLERWMSRQTAVIVTYIAIAGVAVLLGWIIVPPLVSQTQTLVQAVPGALQHARQWVDRWIPGQSRQVAGSASSAVSAALVQAVSLSTQLFSGALAALLIVFFSIYWLMEQPGIHRFALSLTPANRRTDVADILHEMGLATGGYVRGAVIDGAIMALVAWICLLVIGLDYAITLAALTFVAEFVPYLGPFVVGITAVAVGLGQSTTKAVLALLVYTALQEIEGHIVTPNVMRTQTNLPPTIVLFAVFAGTAVGGPLGLIAAIPFAAAVRVLFIRMFVPAIRDKQRIA